MWMAMVSRTFRISAPRTHLLSEIKTPVSARGFSFFPCAASLRCLLWVAGLAWPCCAAAWTRALAVLIAVASGALAMVLTALILKSFLRLQCNGTLDVRNAVGLSGTVYLTIPPARTEVGKVTLLLQDRLTQIDAVTDCQTPIKTGAEVIVIGVSGKTTLIVQPKS